MSDGLRPFIPQAAPPIAEAARPEGMPLTPPTYGAEHIPADAPTNHNFLRSRFVKAALVIGGLAAAAGIGAAGANQFGNSSPTSGAENAAAATAAANKDKKDEVCPDGMFSKETPYAEAPKVQPGSLFSSSFEGDDFSSFLVGSAKNDEPGQACKSPVVAGTLVTVFNSYGFKGKDGNAVRPFTSLTTAANETIAFAAGNPDETENLVTDDLFVAFTKSFELNDEALESRAMFRIEQRQNPDGTYGVVQVPVEVGRMEKGTVRVLDKEIIDNDTTYTNISNVVLFNEESDEMLVEKALDIPIVAPETVTTDEQAAPNEGAQETDDQNTKGQSAGSNANRTNGANKSTSNGTGGGGGTSSGGGAAGCGTGCEGTGDTGSGSGSGTGTGGSGTGTGSGGGGGGTGTGGGGGETPTTEAPPVTKPGLECDPNIEANC